MSKGNRSYAPPLGSTFDDSQYRELARLTGPHRNGREYGNTFSDVTQRFIPNVLLEAYPDRPVSFDLAISVLDQLEAHRPVRVQGTRSEAMTTGLSASGARIRGDDYQHLFAWVQVLRAIQIEESHS